MGKRKGIRPPDNSVHPLSRDEWRKWLRSNHSRDKGVWLIRFKKVSGIQSLDYEAAVEEALCFGWVDSKPNKLDDERSMLWFAPRKDGTGWSRLNKERVDRLIETGRMEPPGLAKVNAAKTDGSWNALDEVESLEIPDDLASALDALPDARRFFEAFPPSVRKNILQWILSAKRADTRLRRIEQTAALADKNERANQWKRG